MSQKSLLKRCSLGVIALFAAFLLHAGAQPKFTLIPTTPTTVQLTTNETRTVRYQVTNQTNVTRTLTMVPIVGISQTTRGKGVCANPFTLAGRQSCLLILQLNGSQLPARVIKGPEVCKTHGPGDTTPDLFLCSQPSVINSLNITVTGSISSLTITVTPANSSIPAGSTQQFTAKGTYANGTSKNLTASVTWSSSKTAVATISNAAGSKGLARGLSLGTTTIKATLGSVSATAGLTVTPSSAMISVSGSPLILFPFPSSVTPATSRFLIVKNNSSTVTATGISATLPPDWTDVTQDSTACQTLAPGASCQLQFTAGTNARSSRVVLVAGSNTNTVASNIAITWPWVTDSVVSALVHDPVKNLIYLGGSFTYVGPNNGHGVPLDEASGAPLPVFPRVNGPVFASISDGANGWYIGGGFTQVGGVARTNLAHINADGTVDPDFAPNPNNRVNALALSGNRLYAGGLFNSIGGENRSFIAKLNATTGMVTGWNANADNFVNTLAVSGNVVYVGGEFTTIGGIPRTYIAAVNATTGLALPWISNDADNFVNAMVVSGSTVYIGGNFQQIGGQPRNHLAALDTSTGAAINSWIPNADNSVYALAISGSTIYAGGFFTIIDGQTRRRMAAVGTNGVVTGWNPDSNGLVYTPMAFG